MGMIEFPFLLRRGDHLLARTPIGVTQDGGVTFSTDIREGETLRFGYGNIDMIFEQSGEIHDRLEQFAPEAIFIYSCITRRFILQEDVDIELQAYESIAPSAGFFTHGEFCDLGDMSPQLNTNIVIAALREGDCRPQARSGRRRAAPSKPDSRHRRYNRIMSRFRYFIAAATEDLARANEELKRQLEEIRTLREILPICTSCKKIRDDRGYWNQLETYIRDHFDAEFSHGLCPECARKLYPDYIEHIGKAERKILEQKVGGAGEFESSNKTSGAADHKDSGPLIHGQIFDGSTCQACFFHVAGDVTGRYEPEHCGDDPEDTGYGKTQRKPPDNLRRRHRKWRRLTAVPRLPPE